MVLISYTKNVSNLTNLYGDMVPGRQKVWMDRQNGWTTPKLYPPTKSGYYKLVSLIPVEFRKPN